MKYLFSLIGVAITLLCYFGCGRDDVGNDSVANSLIIGDTMPAITIEKNRAKR